MKTISLEKPRVLIITRNDKGEEISRVRGRIVEVNPLGASGYVDLETPPDADKRTKAAAVRVFFSASELEPDTDQPG